MTRPRLGWEHALEMRRVLEVGTEGEKRAVLSSRPGRVQARVLLRKMGKSEARQALFELLIEAEIVADEGG